MTASSRIVSATDRFPSAFLAAKATAMDSRKSHNQFKSSVFEATNATAAMTSGREGGIPTENPASEKSKNQQEIALYNPWSLMFSTSGNDNDNSTSVLEDLFATKFYHQNRHSALAGVLFIACLCLLMLGVTYVDPKYNFRLYRVTTYVGLLLFAVGIISTVINAILQKILLSTPTTESVAQDSPTSARRSGELIHRDATTRDLFKWWERSLVIQRLASLCMCFAVVVGKKAGCIAATDPIAVKLCTTSIQLDAAILMLTAAHCLMYPLRWVFHLPLTLMTLVILFGIRFIPGIAVIDEKFMITFALVMVLPIAMFLVIRYLRERDLRQLFLAELQLETTLEHLTVVSARHETLLVPCVPLPVEEQVKLLQRSHSTHNSHADYLWGLGHETIIGMLQLDNFSHWVQQAGACESARALATLVKTVDKYYELLSPQTMSLLKCHVDGDRYLLVSPDAGDVGILMLIMLLARREYEFRREFPSETQRPAVHAAVTSGVLGVTGIGASGTLTPCGPALDRVRVALQLAPRQQDGSILDDQVGEEEIRVSPDVATTLSLHLLDNVWRGGVPSTMFEASNNSSATSSVMMFAKVPFTHLIPSVNARNEMNTALLADRLAAKALAQRSSVFLICIAAGTDDGSNVPHSQTMGDPFVAAALQQLSTKATRSASSSCLKVMMGGSAIQRGSFSEHNISSSVNSASAIARPPQNPSTGGTPLMIATGSSALQPPLTAATATPLMMTMAVKPPLVSFSAGAAGTSSPMNSELGRSGGPNVKDQKGGSEGNSPPPQQASTASASLILQQTAIAPPPPPSPSPLCTDLTMIQRCPLAPLQKFLNIDTEKRFQLHARHSVSGTELLAVSIGSFLSAVFVIIICCLYEITSFELISPMSFSVAAASFGAVLILLALLHGYVQQSDRRRRKILVAHELLFVCFYAMIVGMNYSAKPQSSAVGASQLVWLYMLLSLNFVRPRAHGVLPHIALDTLGSLAFLLQALIYPYATSLLRYVNIACDILALVGPFFVNASCDSEARQRFTIEVSLDESYQHLTLLNAEIDKIIADTRVNNPAAIFVARAQAKQNRHHRHRHRQQRRMFHAVDENNNDDVSPLCVANVDPSTSTTAASRIMDSGVLVVEFQMPTTFFAGGVSSTASPDQLKAFVGQVKRFHYAVDFLLEHDFKKTLRIVKATPSMIWVVSNAVVLGNSNSSSSSASSDVSLIEAGLDILRHLCPQHGLIGRALIDSGPFVGILLGTSSMSFEFTGPVMERARALLEAAAWGGLFVTHRLIRYCGGTADLRMSAATATMEVKTPRGLIGKISGNFEPWRVARAPKILVAAVVV